MPETLALIVAAGKGERAGGGVPKQYRALGGRTVLRRSIEAFAAHPAVAGVMTVIAADDEQRYAGSVTGLPLLPPVSGGATRQESVRNGLEALIPYSPDFVLIHDAARPLVSGKTIAAVIAALEGAEAAAPLLVLTDTLRRQSDEGYALVPREGMSGTQTPQGFHFGKILAAHRRFAALSLPDDLALAERAGLTFAAVPGQKTNLKLTMEDDFPLADSLLASGLSDIRTGTGFDVHGFTDGDHVMLCGVKVPHDKGLAGHSDADAGLHALTDAILGAIAAGDIGLHFQSNDDRWRGVSSDRFLAEAASLVKKAGGLIAHVDITIICERPKLTPYREAMRARVADILGLDIGRVSVKATTTDGLGFTGRREGIAAQAIATVRLPA